MLKLEHTITAGNSSINVISFHWDVISNMRNKMSSGFSADCFNFRTLAVKNQNEDKEQMTS
jgi:hypothetical protein